MTWQPNENSPAHLGPRDVEAKIDGIVEQTRHDLALGHARSAHELLAERFAQSGIAVPRQRVVALAASLEGVGRA